MEYYKNFMFNSRAPSDEYLDEEQSILDDYFANSPTYHDDIYAEKGIGTLAFEKIDARIVKVIDSKVGERMNDDYRKIIFPNMKFKPVLGSRYKFDNNVWIVYSTNNIRGLHSSCYLRRCNNTINVQDMYGNIHEEPCIVDLKPTKSGTLESESLSVPLARQTIAFQVNEWTKNLFINSRIMFNRQVYKIESVVEMDRTQTFNPQSITYAKFYISNDLRNEYDNEELQIADYKDYQYKLVAPDSVNVKPADTGKFTLDIYLNSAPIETPVEWISSNPEILKVNRKTGEYEAIIDGTAKVTAILACNKNIQKDIVVKVSVDSIPTYKNIITPEDRYITLNNSCRYEVYEMKDGTKTDTSFSISCSGVPSKYYESTIEGNSIIIKNLLQNENNLLQVEFKNLRDNSIEKMFVELGGLF